MSRSTAELCCYAAQLSTKRSWDLSGEAIKNFVDYFHKFVLLQLTATSFNFLAARIVTIY